MDVGVTASQGSLALELGSSSAVVLEKRPREPSLVGAATSYDSIPSYFGQSSESFAFLIILLSPISCGLELGLHCAERRPIVARRRQSRLTPDNLLVMHHQTMKPRLTSDNLLVMHRQTPKNNTLS